MARERALFSESWHRVAQQKIRLRPSVTVHKQYFRGELWYVAHDSYGDKYFRFRPEAWEFISRLDGKRTVEDIWQGCLKRHQDKAPGQGEVVQMLAQLYNGNLIISDVPADVGQLFERLKKRKANEWKARLFGIFFLRIPLWDPDTFLNRTIPYIRFLLSPIGAILWLAAFAGALSVVIANWSQATSQSAGVFDPSNLFLLYIAFAFTKLIHEMGHAYAVKRFGGEVHKMGITILVFTPIPFVDATAAWAFRERWKRVWVGSSGMIVELFLASLAAFVWSTTGPGMVNGLAYNVMIVASISTLLFNLNPLLRFDGYYILADLTDSPNLNPRSTRQWYYWIEKYLFGGEHAQNPSSSVGDSIWLSVFGITAWVYRIFITFTIIIFVADKFFGLGFLAGVLTLVGFVVVPLYKGTKYLLAEPRIEKVRGRAIGVTLGFFALLIILLGVIPMPNHFRAPGVVKAQDSQYLFTESGGMVYTISVKESKVRAGTPVLSMMNPELELEISNLTAELAQLDALERQSFTQSPVDLAPLAERRRFVESKLADRLVRKVKLDVESPVPGNLVVFSPHELEGRWLSRGAVVGEVVGEGSWEFRAVVSQNDASKIFQDEAIEFEIRLPGIAGKSFTPESVRLIPGEQNYLPSPALGWAAGGPIRTVQDDRSGLEAYESFFLVIGTLPADDASLWHGRTGIARFTAPPQPLLSQWLQDFRQLLQRRFKL